LYAEGLKWSEIAIGLEGAAVLLETDGCVESETVCWRGARVGCLEVRRECSETQRFGEATDSGHVSSQPLVDHTLCEPVGLAMAGIAHRGAIGIEAKEEVARKSGRSDVLVAKEDSLDLEGYRVVQIVEILWVNVKDELVLVPLTEPLVWNVTADLIELD
jgi:hypothetical protein